jgi:FAD synthetase
MSFERLTSKYIASADHVLGIIEIVEEKCVLSRESVKNVVECAKAYLDDAKYYFKRKRFEVSLASVAYCEGLLDALKMLGAVRFEWPREKEKGEK